MEASSITHTPALAERWRPELSRTVWWLSDGGASMCRIISRRARPDVAVGDLEQVARRVLEVERAPAAAPLGVVRDLDPRGCDLLAPAVVVGALGAHAGVAGTRAAVVGDGAAALREAVAVEEQQHTGADAVRDAVGPGRDGRQPQHVAVEALDRLALAAVVVERGLEDAVEAGHGGQPRSFANQWWANGSSLKAGTSR